MWAMWWYATRGEEGMKQTGRGCEDKASYELVNKERKKVKRSESEQGGRGEGKTSEGPNTVWHCVVTVSMREETNIVWWG